MKISELVKYLDDIYPQCYAEKWDNCGALITPTNEVLRGVTIALDCTESVLDYAIEQHHNFIFTHHPIIFDPLKRINAETRLGRILIKALRHNIAIYAAHTNADVLQGGVSWKLAEKLGLTNIKVLSPQTGLYKKIVVFVPHSHTEKVRSAMCNAGAGCIGSYSDASFVQSGMGTFKPQANAVPYVGSIGQMEYVEEDKIEILLPPHLLRNVVSAMLSVHPYEEVAYDIYTLNNSTPVGLGVIGELSVAVSGEEFIRNLKMLLNIPSISYSFSDKHRVKTIAVCGGSAAFLIDKAISSNADIFISSEFKHHQFIEARASSVGIVDIGHYESEKYILDRFREVVMEKITTFALPVSLFTESPVFHA